MNGEIIAWAVLGLVALALCVYLVDQLFRPGGR
ncbi:potassium-transporting ATPase subunit F [Pseudarthrobacter chlorophenolicus]|nr:potassium-transporting ATPase subunit F [Pseudarthrobacter chlorophenolicus]SDQ95337.1 F subunit of K+-transporting ATPase (Potass_KdpF) [Pseudarthrobacter chlorophenolicus]